MLLFLMAHIACFGMHGERVIVFWVSQSVMSFNSDLEDDNSFPALKEASNYCTGQFMGAVT